VSVAEEMGRAVRDTTAINVAEGDVAERQEASAAATFGTTEFAGAHRKEESADDEVGSV